MPEGPSILHLKNQLLPFKGKTVKAAGGYGKMETGWIKGKKLLDIQTWGKHLLLIFSNGTVRVHLGLFGDVTVNERKKVNRSFYLEFQKGEINGYVVRAEKLAKPWKESYDWRTDILSKSFDKKYLRHLLKERPEEMISEVLMDQAVFSGVGNKIRNEALYRAGIHPLSITGKIPPVKITKLLNEVVAYARIFYNQLERKGKNEDFGVYQQKYAPDGSEVTMKISTKTRRKIYYSEHRQQLYA